MTDKLLFDGIKRGYEQAFEQLFRRYYQPMMRFVWGYVKCEAIAEELVQELFTKIWENRKTLNINRSVKAYLYTSARNMSLDYLKHKVVENAWEQEKKALHLDTLPESTIEKNLHNKMVLQEVEKAIQSLPERRRLIFILSRYEDMTYKEIADFLDISVNTVETQISRALSALREQFSSLLNIMVGITTLIHKL